jgi:hypothetical protein
MLLLKSVRAVIETIAMVVESALLMERLVYAMTIFIIGPQNSVPLITLGESWPLVSIAILGQSITTAVGWAHAMQAAALAIVSIPSIGHRLIAVPAGRRHLLQQQEMEIVFQEIVPNAATEDVAMRLVLPVSATIRCTSGRVRNVPLSILDHSWSRVNAALLVQQIIIVHGWVLALAMEVLVCVMTLNTAFPLSAVKYGIKISANLHFRPSHRQHALLIWFTLLHLPPSPQHPHPQQYP